MTALLLVLLVVILQVACAVLLKLMAMQPEPSLLLLGGGIALVAALNGGRFALWGVAHQRFPLSTSYPFSALFFPLILWVSYLFGDPIHANQLTGAGLVVAGVVWLAVRTSA